MLFRPSIVLLLVTIFSANSIQAISNDSSSGDSAVRIAEKVDAILADQFEAAGVETTAICSDEDFLRRVSLDITGQLPAPQEVSLFGLSPSSEKRGMVINDLLNSPEYGKLWASYWNDVIFLRATEQRSRLAQPAFQSWMVGQLNDNRPWDEITRELLTATGSVREVGETGLIFAHTGDPAELAAEVSRIFLGIQMSCANCHDHPTDSWKREQFHQLAAFFPRLSVRPEDPGQIRTFAVSSFEDRRGSGRRGADFDVDQFFRFLDRNRDGNLSKSEARGPVEARFDQIVERFDRNKDQMLSKEEFAEARSQANTQPGQGAAEYYMPDLDNPASQGLLIEPVFFISEVKGPALSPGADDLTRRSALVDYLTSKSNPWFSRAIVNRIWGELLGRGFYMPIDDMGPERTPVHPEVLELLSEEFVTHGYDLKWLFRTILNTQAYQRSLAVDPVAEQIPFAAASPGRLRADQIYNSLNAILGTSGPVPFRGGRDAMAMQVQGIDPRKAAFSALFGVDPSTPQEDILGTVPQALFLMNTGVVENQVRATGSTRLAGLLKEFDVDEDALAELYLLVLTRSPSSRELAINLEYIKEVGSRGEAYEDIYWSLLNSTEFCSRR